MRVVRLLAIGSAALAATVAIGHVSGNQPDRDEVAAARESLGIPLTARRIDVGDVELHTVMAGPEDGMPVVLLHGFPELWYAWRGPMAVLAREGFRVIVPDQRGYNRSDKPPAVSDYRIDRLAADVAGLVRALGYEQVDLVGHDWGGGVAWRVAIAHPEVVRRLAILDTPHPRAGEGFESEEDVISWYRTFIQIPWLPGFAARVANWQLVASNLRGTSRPGTFPDEQLDFFRSAWDRDGAIHTMGNWYRASARHGDEVKIEGDQRVAAPTLVLVAEEDSFIPKDLSRRSIAFLDDGRLVDLDFGTHWVIQEEPERIGDLLADFFREPR
jgi:pimeloyl-ACP methyl ester carboxylesterase